jgi:haloacetate dehalogenase
VAARRRNPALPGWVGANPDRGLRDGGQRPARRKEVAAFEGFTHVRTEANGTAIDLMMTGSGDPVLLLHGYPQTRAIWHRVAPALADRFTVVCPDLRGYGDSAKPPSDATHEPYAKRVMARDQVELMRGLGFDRFAVVGHDRGARVARRAALDHPGTVTRLAVLDIVPTRTIYETLDREHALSVWRYFFLTQPADLPERMIGADPDGYLRWTFDEWCGTPGALSTEALAEYRRCFGPETIRATCEDYRAGATIDLVHDAADAGRGISCPVLVLWSGPTLGAAYDVLSIWRGEAGDVTGEALDCGHFLPEERPDEVSAKLRAFLAAGR